MYRVSLIFQKNKILIILASHFKNLTFDFVVLYLKVFSDQKHHNHEHQSRHNRFPEPTQTKQ